MQQYTKSNFKSFKFEISQWNSTSYLKNWYKVYKRERNIKISQELTTLNPESKGKPNNSQKKNDKKDFISICFQLSGDNNYYRE